MRVADCRLFINSTRCSHASVVHKLTRISSWTEYEESKTNRENDNEMKAKSGVGRVEK